MTTELPPPDKPTLLILTGEFAPYRGGIGTYVMEMARAAQANGYIVTVLAPDYHADQLATDAKLPFGVIRYADGVFSAKGMVTKARWLRSFARHHRFDIVHAADWSFYIALALSAFRRSARCLLTFHGTEISMMARPSRRMILRIIGLWRGWAEYVANSNFTADYLCQHFPMIDRARVKVALLGVRPLEALPPDRSAARAALSLTADDVLLVTLGRIVERKGHHILAQALNILPHAIRRRIVWYVVGPPVDQDYATRVQASLTDGIVRSTFTGGLDRSEVDRILVAGDLFCLPAIWGVKGEFEGFGLVYLEAGLFGLPALGTKLGGIPDAVVDGETGILVEPSDAQALADAIIHIVENPALRARMAIAAQAHANAATWDQVVAETYR